MKLLFWILFDQVSNQEAVDIARPLCVGNNRQQPLLACKKLVELSVSRGSVDDISVMIIKLQNYIWSLVVQERRKVGRVNGSLHLN